MILWETYFDSAQQALTEGDDSKAAELFASAYEEIESESVRDDRWLRTILGWSTSLVRQGQYETATRVLQVEATELATCSVDLQLDLQAILAQLNQALGDTTTELACWASWYTEVMKMEASDARLAYLRRAVQLAQEMQADWADAARGLLYDWSVSVLGPEHVETLAVAQQRLETYLQAQDWVKAEPLLRARLKLLEPGQAGWLKILAILGQALRAQNKSEEAWQIYSELFSHKALTEEESLEILRWAYEEGQAEPAQSLALEYLLHLQVPLPGHLDLYDYVMVLSQPEQQLALQQARLSWADTLKISLEARMDWVYELAQFLEEQRQPEHAELFWDKILSIGLPLRGQADASLRAARKAETQGHPDSELYRAGLMGRLEQVQWEDSWLQDAVNWAKLEIQANNQVTASAILAPLSVQLEKRSLQDGLQYAEVLHLKARLAFSQEQAESGMQLSEQAFALWLQAEQTSELGIQIGSVALEQAVQSRDKSGYEHWAHRLQKLGVELPPFERGFSLEDMQSMYQSCEWSRLEKDLRELLPGFSEETPEEHFVAYLWLAESLEQQSRWDEALEFRQQSQSILLERLGANHPLLLKGQVQLGQCLKALSRFAEAERVLARSVRAHEKAFGSDSLAVGQVLLALAESFRLQGKDNLLEAVSGRAVGLLEKHLPVGHPERLHAKRDLMQWMMDQGRFAEVRQQLSLMEQEESEAFGVDHPELAVTLSQWASLETAEGNYVAAEDYYRRSLLLFEQGLGDAHPNVAATLNNLGQNLYRQARYLEAAEILERALPIFASNDIGRASTMANLGLVWQAQKDHVRAQQWLEESLRLSQEWLGDDDLEVAFCCFTLAEVMASQGQIELACNYAQRALDIRERRLGALHPETSASQAQLSSLLVHAGRKDDAIPLVEGSLRIQIQALGSNHPELIPTCSILGQLYTAAKEWDKAEKTLLKALSLISVSTAQVSAELAQRVSDLGELRAAQGDLEQAIVFSVRAVEIFSEALGSQHEALDPVLLRLSRLYIQASRFKEAEAVLKQLLSLRSQRFGSEEPAVALIWLELAKLQFTQGRQVLAETLGKKALGLIQEQCGKQHEQLRPCLDFLVAHAEKYGNEAQLNAYKQQLADLGKVSHESLPESVPVLQAELVSAVTDSSVEESVAQTELPDQSLPVTLESSQSQVNTITEKVEPAPEVIPQIEPEPSVVTEVVPEPEPSVVAEVVPEPEPSVVAEVVPEPQPSAMTEVVAEPQVVLATTEALLPLDRLESGEGKEEVFPVFESGVVDDLAVQESEFDSSLLDTTADEEAPPEWLLDEAEVELQPPPLSPEEQAVKAAVEKNWVYVKELLIPLLPQRSGAELAALMRSLAQAESQLGQTLQAEKLLLQAITLLSQAHGENHPDMVESLGDLAQISFALDKAEQAESLLRRATEIRMRNHGSDQASVIAWLLRLGKIYLPYKAASALAPLLRAAHMAQEQLQTQDPLQVEVLWFLAQAYEQTEDFEEAITCLRRLLALTPEDRSLEAKLELSQLLLRVGQVEAATQILHQLEVHMPVPEPEIEEQVKAVLGHLMVLDQRLEEAEPRLLLALQRRSQRLSTQHPELRSILCDLAMLYSQRQVYQQVAIFAQQALALTPEEEKATRLQLYSQLAPALMQLERQAEAESTYQDWLTLVVAENGENHSDQLPILWALARLLQQRGESMQAQELREKAWKILSQSKDLPESELLLPLEELAQGAMAQNAWDKAEPWLRKAYVIAEKQDTLVAARLAYSLGEVFRATGRLTEAENALRRSLEFRQSALGADHVATLQSLQALAVVYSAQNRFEAAQSMLSRCLDAGKQTLGEHHPDLAGFYRALGVLWSQTGRREEAEKSLLQALALIEKLSPPHQELVPTLEALGQYYMCLDQLTQAAPYYTRALDSIEQSLGPSHLAVADSLLQLGELQQRQGNLSEAEKLFRRCLEIRSHKLPPQSIRLAQVRQVLAQLLQQRGDTQAARSLFEQALASLWHEQAGESVQVAECLEGLGLLELQQGLYAEAEVRLQKALAIREKEPAEHRGPEINTHKLLARVFLDSRRPEMAERSLKRALEMAQKTFGSDRPEVAACLEQLGALYLCQGRYVAAEALFDRALEIRERSQSANHPDSGFCLLGLAQIYLAQNQLTRAWQMAEAAKKIYEATAAQPNLETAQSLYWMAEILRLQTRFKEAAAFYQRCLEIRNQLLGNDHLEVQRGLQGLGVCLMEDGKAAQAERIFTHVLRHLESQLGNDHPDLAISLQGLGLLHRSQGRGATAELYLKRALELRMKGIGNEHPDLAASLQAMAQLYMDQRNDQAAEVMLKQALSIREKALRADHPAISSLLLLLAGLYKSQERFSEAEPRLKRVLDQREKILGLHHQDTGAIVQELGELYLLNGQFSLAETFLKRALDIFEKSLGQEHTSVLPVLHFLWKAYDAQNRNQEAASIRSRIQTLEVARSG